MTSQPPNASPVQPGHILAGKYRVERVIGLGGMGVVVEARHVTLDERVALKFLLPEWAANPEAAARFHREAKAAVKIKSEHVARVTDVGTLETGAPYMVMEYLEGTDLSNKLQKDGVLQVEDAVDFVIQGCDALTEAHGYGIVHRDIKPANLFLTKRPNGTPLVKVLDFGISKTSGPQVDSLTKTTASMGSALYMSPEQMQQTRGVDHRTDIYALGITLYELLAGKQPFYADTLPQLCAEIFTGTPMPIRNVRQDVSPGLAAVLEKAYARDRGQRYQSVGELVLALAPYAPRRSQTAIESVAKMSGLEAAAAAAGAPAPATPPSSVVGSGPNTLASGGTQIVDSGPARSSQVPVLGGLPPTTGPGSVVDSVSVPVNSSKGTFVALAAVAVLGLAAGGVYLATRGRGANASTTAAASTADTAPVETATAAPVVTATAAPVMTTTAAPVTPTATAEAAPSVVAPSPSVAVAASPKGPRATGAVARPAPAPTPAAPTAAPAAPSKPPPKPLPGDPAGF
jgi:serine/threonine-protein kinase